MEKFISVLFNTNHEMSWQAIAVLVVIAVIFGIVSKNYQDKHRR